jgi:hypothetical protein
MKKHACYNKSIKGRYRQLKYAAKRSAKGFNINFNEFVQLQSAPCFYCGGELPKNGSGVDRINNTKGYKKGNIRPCCHVCNVAKNDMTETQFYKHILKIVKNLKLL